MKKTVQPIGYCFAEVTVACKFNIVSNLSAPQASAQPRDMESPQHVVDFQYSKFVERYMLGTCWFHRSSSVSHTR